METYAQKARRLATMALERGNLVRALDLWALADLPANVDVPSGIAPLDFN